MDHERNTIMENKFGFTEILKVRRVWCVEWGKCGVECGGVVCSV